MKGVILNIVEEVVTERFGPDVWDDLLDAAQVEGAYTALGTYDDAELVGIVAAASTALGVSEADVLRLVGREGFDGLATRYSYLLEGHHNSRSVLADLHDVIHPQVLAVSPGASVPHFSFADRGATIELEYRSDRGLCHLAEGLAAGAADHFGEPVDVQQPQCRHEGDPVCVITVTYLADG